jgi:hypothetical protein
MSKEKAQEIFNQLDLFKLIELKTLPAGTVD